MSLSLGQLPSTSLPAISETDPYPMGGCDGRIEARGEILCPGPDRASVHRHRSSPAHGFTRRRTATGYRRFTFAVTIAVGSRTSVPPGSRGTGKTHPDRGFGRLFFEVDLRRIRISIRVRRSAKWCGTLQENERSDLDENRVEMGVGDGTSRLADDSATVSKVEMAQASPQPDAPPRRSSICEPGDDPRSGSHRRQVRTESPATVAGSRSAGTPPVTRPSGAKPGDPMGSVKHSKPVRSPADSGEQHALAAGRASRERSRGGGVGFPMIWQAMLERMKAIDAQTKELKAERAGLARSSSRASARASRSSRAGWRPAFAMWSSVMRPSTSSAGSSATTSSPS